MNRIHYTYIKWREQKKIVCFFFYIYLFLATFHQNSCFLSVNEPKEIFCFIIVSNMLVSYNRKMVIPKLTKENVFSLGGIVQDITRINILFLISLVNILDNPWVLDPACWNGLKHKKDMRKSLRMWVVLLFLW